MWTKELLQFLLETNDVAVERALVQLLERQTRDEQDAQQTKHHNDRGFLPYDAPRMSIWAKNVKRGLPLSPKQLGWLRRPTQRFSSRIGKYAAQLAEMLNEKIKHAEEQIKIWEAERENAKYADSFEYWGAKDREAQKHIAGWKTELERLKPNKKLLDRYERRYQTCGTSSASLSS